jgi:hypothetical protein
MFETMLEESGGMRKRTVKLVRNSHPYIHFTLKVRIYLSTTNYTSASYLAVSSDRRYSLAPINENQEVKTGVLRTALSTSICCLTPRFLIKMLVHLVATRKKKPALCRPGWCSKQIRLEDIF